MFLLHKDSEKRILSSSKYIKVLAFEYFYRIIVEVNLAGLLPNK